ncbi:hypothetical protein [Alteromonas gilva]|uniref:Xylose isomerase n=1 Tax=Alteromonas gilva TaxID=2987522 RepID=A0ABT5L614_9ALTE|nr:hypothetical protein [Alteromonas gilva]MDC8831926.1 hypothetical protein [Alteromonas gilva]
MVTLDVFQSMWAMEFKRPDGFEWTLREKIARIAGAGFKGVSFDIGYHSEDTIRQAMPLLQEFGLDLCYNAFVKSVPHYREIVDFVTSQAVKPRFIAIVGQIEPWDLHEVAQTTRQWLNIGAAGGVETHVEVHRNCMTNDLLFTLQLMDKVPDLLMVADLSHVLVNQEWYLPLHEQARQRISQFLSKAEAFHGRVATREQIQVPILFPQHKPWFELFKGWWQEGFEKWIDRHGVESDRRCVFLSELGPPVYAITGEDGYELSDRWDEALLLKKTAEQLWQDALKRRRQA